MTRVPPHDTEAEASVLASMMVVAGASESAAGLRPDDFYLPRHGVIYHAMRSLEDDGAPLDPTTVCAKLESTGRLAAAGGRGAVHGLLGASTLHPAHYAQVVAGYARSRHCVALAGSLEGAAYSGDPEKLSDALAALEDFTASDVVVDPPAELSQLAQADADTDWVIPGLLARLEAVLIVAEPGAGKTTLLRQIAACAASALHPFTRVPIRPCRTLSFDFQDPPGPAIRATRTMLNCAGDYYRHTWWVELRQQGLDLTSGRDQAWFEAKVASVNADIVLAGPLYNMIRGAANRSKQSEETAEMAGRFLMDMMARQSCALIVEAHAPHGAELRVRGSKYWEDWAAFGFGLKDEGASSGDRELTVERFRGDREMGRQWPSRYIQGRGRWPWEATGIPGGGHDWDREEI